MDGAGASNSDSTAAPTAPTRLTSALLWLVLLVELAIPSSYYLWRRDQEDERFAWRMFSSLRFRSCQVEVFERDPGGEYRVPLPDALHASWIGALRRGRERVIEHFLQGRCQRPGVRAARLVRSCREVDGRSLAPQRFIYACDPKPGRLMRDPASMDPPP